MRTFKHWSLRYAIDRISELWYERKQPDAPWLTASMSSILSEWLWPTDTGVEWGSGRSTLWFAKRVKRLVSIEHDSQWYHKVRVNLEAQSVSNVTYRLVESPHDYVDAGLSLSGGGVDFCLVDGIERHRCAAAGADLLKPGGILIIDNVNWFLPGSSVAPNSRSVSDGPTAEWQSMFNTLATWRQVRTTSGVTDTGFFVKPNTQVFAS